MTDGTKPKKKKKARPAEASPAHGSPMEEGAPAKATAAKRRIADADARERERSSARSLAVAAGAAAVIAPLATALTVNPATGMLVLCGVVLLTAIAFLWTSVRTLGGDAALPEALEALEDGALALPPSPAELRKATALLQLKDLERERALGKLNDEDYAELRETYRAEAKAALEAVEAETAATIAEAERLAEAHLARAAETAATTETEGAPAATIAEAASIACPACATENDDDARFCKSCAAPLSPEGALTPPAEAL